MNIGNKIISLRSEKKMSQSELADLLDVSRQTISKWECNICDPEVGRIKQMAVIFNVTTDYLLDNNIDNENITNNNKKTKLRIKMSKNLKISIGLGLIAFLMVILTFFYCYQISPYTYIDKDSALHNGIIAHLLGHNEVGNTGITLVVLSLSVILIVIIQLLLTIIRKRGNKTC